MSLIRKQVRARSQLLLLLALSVLGFTALVPTGHMLAPTGTGYLAITPCPETNALYRAVLAHADRNAQSDGGIDHAAMGHTGGGADDPDQAPPTGVSSGKDCAFSGLAAGATLPDLPELGAQMAIDDDVTTPELRALAARAARYLRPPLRGPPLLG